MDDEAGVDGQAAVGRGHLVGVGVAAQPVVGLEQRDVGGPGRDVRSRQSGDAGADDGDPALVRGAHQAFSKLKSMTGSDVGTVEPPAGSTVIPAPMAPAASPSSSTVWALDGISPAGTMPSFGSWNQSS